MVWYKTFTYLTGLYEHVKSKSCDSLIYGNDSVAMAASLSELVS